jgi:diguanylate cyclase (GGDEF)-like protein
LVLESRFGTAPESFPSAFYDLDVDRLTGLADRSEFFASLPTLSAQERITLVIFDVDDLRALNGRCGRKEGDRVLTRLGSFIEARCGAREAAARLGGDEFALILLEDDPLEVMGEIEGIRKRFREETAGATLSVGICDGKTLRRASGSRSLFEGAHDALVDAKKNGPGGLSFFSAA